MTVKEAVRAAAPVRDHRAGAPAAEAVLARVAERAAAIRVQTAMVRELRAAVLAVAWAAGMDQVLVLLRAAALAADREAVSGEPGMAPAADLALAQVVVPGARSAAGPAVALAAGSAADPAVALGPVVAQDCPVDREVVPVVRVSALPVAPPEVPQEDRPEEVVQRAVAVALQEVQAVAQAAVEAGAARVPGQGAALVVARVADQGVGLQRVAQATAVPGPAIMANTG